MFILTIVYTHIFWSFSCCWGQCAYNENIKGSSDPCGCVSAGTKDIEGDDKVCVQGTPNTIAALSTFEGNHVFKNAHKIAKLGW